MPIKTPTYTVDGTLVWGATGRIVQQLLDRLAPMLTAAAKARRAGLPIDPT